MGITVTPKQVVWAVLDTSLSEIVDCGSCPFFDETEQFSHSTILHSVIHFKMIYTFIFTYIYLVNRHLGLQK